MAFKNPSTTPKPFFLLFFLSSTILISLVNQGLGAKETVVLLHAHDLNLETKGFRGEDQISWRWNKKSARRVMIGSIAPTCTYNECRGCRFKCRAEQVPVDANDPVNSAYHYRCVCHR